MKTDGIKALMDYSDLLIDAVCIVDREGNFLHVSAAFQRIFGYEPAEVVGSNMINMVLPEDRAKTQEVVYRMESGQPQTHFENRYLRKDGQIVHVMWAARWSPEHQVRIAVARDITARKHTELLQAALYDISEAVHNADRLSDLFANIHAIINDLLPGDNLLIALKNQNDDLVDIPYYSDRKQQRLIATEWQNSLVAEVMDQQKTQLMTPDDLGAVPAVSRGVDAMEIGYWIGVPLQSQEQTIGALILESCSAEIRYTERDAELLLFVSQQIATAVERQRNYDQIRYMALHDPLTSLSNLTLLRDRMATALARAKRQETRMALLYIDLNEFKEINDQMGHAAGDELLIKVAQRLSASVREADTVSRVGGDEFVIVLENVGQSEDTDSMAEKIVMLFEDTFEIGNTRLGVVPSVGVSVYPDDGTEAEDLLRQADEGMYIKKRAVQASS